MRKDTLAHRALALALVLPLATAACADEGMEEDLDTDFETTEPQPDARGEQFSLEGLNDSGIDGEGWARVDGESLVVTLSFADQATAPQDLSLYLHSGDCGAEDAPRVTELQRDRMAGTGAPTATQPGTDAATPPADDGTAEAGTTEQAGMAGTGTTYSAPLSAVTAGAPMAGAEDGEAEIGGADWSLSVRAEATGADATAADAEEGMGQALFCGDLPSEVLEGRTGASAPGAGTTPQDEDMR